MNIEKKVKIPGHPILEPRINDLVRTGVLQPLAATLVDNIVVYTNPTLNHQILKELGLLLQKRCPQSAMVSLGLLRRHPDRLVYGMPHHKRSIISTANSGIEWQTQRFPFITQKGTGLLLDPIRVADSTSLHLQHYVTPRGIRRLKDEPEEAFGLCSIQSAHIEVPLSYHLQKNDIRVPPILAVVKLLEIVNETGQIQSVNQDEYGGLTPVIILRAWRSPFRVCDLESVYAYTQRDLEKYRHLVINTITDLEILPNLIKPNNGKNIELVVKYFEWFCGAIGSELGRFHKLGYVHRNLGNLHNITLAAEFADFDTVQYLNKSDSDGSRHRQKDYKDLTLNIDRLLRALESIFDLNFKETKHQYYNLVQDSYSSAFNN